ncbi:MAG: hypothetical protein ACFFCF_07820 [Promethearchaeota archaeon]
MNVLLILLLTTVLATSNVPLPSPQTSVYRGGPTTISVQLKSQSGTPIENATVLFFHETQNELLGTAITNSSGFAHFIWMIAASHELGPVQLNATFRGDPERYLLPSMVPIPLTIFAKMQIEINVTDESGIPIDSDVRIGQRLFFYTTVTDDNHNPLNAVTVQMVMEPNQIISERITPSNGSIIFSCLLNHTAYSSFAFTIRSLNQGYYNGTEIKLRFLIQNSSTQFIGLPKFWHPSFGYSLRGKLQRPSGEGIPNASIQLLLEPVEVSKITQTEDDGTFYFDLFDVFEYIQYSQYLIVQYKGTPGQSARRAVIGIIASPPHNPFTQSIEPTSFLVWLPLIHQSSILIVSFLTIGTSLVTLKMKRSTKRIFSH